MFLELPRPTIIGHRGASAHAPENTIAAFELAVQQHADAIELDAKLTVDRHVVVIHDQTVDRTTDGTGQVNKLSLKALRELDAGSSFDISFKGEKIPTLVEVFETVGHKTCLNIELTNYASNSDDLPERVAALIQKHNLQRNILISSFNPFTLLRAHKLLPEVPFGLLTPSKRGFFLANLWVNKLIPYNTLNPCFDDTNPRLVKRLHQRGKYIFVYTVNEPEAMRSLVAWGVDGFFTDDPVLAKRVIS
jgi:glycerophosphoryl diester phosphodiesterase